MSDSRVILLAPRFDEPADDRACVARSLAYAYASEGVEVFVICPVGASKPSVEIRPGIDIRRLSVPRCDDSAFAIRAIGAAWEIERRHPIAAIECVDSAAVTIACKFAAIAGLLASPVVHVRVHAACGDRDACADAMADAVRAFMPSSNAGVDIDMLSLPRLDNLWRAPRVDACVMAIPTSLPQARHAELANAFGESGLADKDWVLAAVGFGGRWILSAQDQCGGGGKDCVVLVGDDPTVFPAVGMQAIAAGSLALIAEDSPLAAHVPAHLRSTVVYAGKSGLIEAMKRVACATPDQRLAWARQLQASVFPTRAAELVTRTRSFWRSLHSRRNPAAIAAAWRLAEGNPSDSPLLEACR